MTASWLSVHSWAEKISQTKNKDGHLEHFWTGGKSMYHQHMWRSFGLGCQENDCELNDEQSNAYQQLRRAGY